MEVGFFEKDITPHLGSIIPGGFAARYAAEVLDPLLVRAAVFKSGESSVAIAA